MIQWQCTARRLFPDSAERSVRIFRFLLDWDSGAVPVRIVQIGVANPRATSRRRGPAAKPRSATLLRRCALPAPKTFDVYDWSAVSWPEGMGRESLLALDFVERREDLVLMGGVGTGKTHMASALCALACERRLEARFFTASSLVMRLRRARDDGRLDREAALIGKARLLVNDELGFLPLGAGGARLLF